MKTHVLKDCTFTSDIDAFSEPAFLRALSDAELRAVARQAEGYWSARRGAKPANHGKHFTAADIVADMLATGERSAADGGMTKQDEKDIAALFKTYGLTCADDIVRGHKTEADKDAAVARFAAQHGIGEHAIDKEAAASDNAAHLFIMACANALDRAIEKWNARVDASGTFTRNTDDTTLNAALAFIRAKRRFLKDA